MVNRKINCNLSLTYRKEICCNNITNIYYNAFIVTNAFHIPCTITIYQIIEQMRAITFLSIFLFLTTAQAQVNNKLAKSPPMGWNSWNYFGKENINENLIKEVIDAMVYELYFEEEFKKAGIEFMKYAQRDFKSIEGKSEREAIAIIEKAYQTLREKDNEIRNNLKLMDIELADLIMPIKTAK